MENKTDNIGKLFQEKFEDYSVEGSSEEWLALDMKLDKVNFFKFNIAHFNVYYASLIGICFSLSSAVFVDHFILEPKPVSHIQQTEQPSPEDRISGPDKEVSKKSTIPVEENAPAKEKGETKAVSTPSTIKKASPQEEPKNKDITPSVEENTIVQDSKQNNLNTENPSTKTPVKTTNKKTVYITKQDTLIVYDTLKVNKRKSKQ